MSFRRRMVLLAAGAVAAAVVLASVVVYVVTRNELRGQIDVSLRQKITPGQPQAVQIRTELSAPQLAKLKGQGTLSKLPFSASGSAGIGTAARGASGQLSGTAPVRAAEAGPGGIRQSTEEVSVERRVAVGAGGHLHTERSTLSGPAGAIARLTLPSPTLGGAAGYVQLLQANGKVVGPEGRPSLIPVTAATRAVGAGRLQAFYSNATVDGTPVRILTARAPEADGVLQVALPLTDLDSTLSHLKLVLVLVSLGGIALAAALGLFVSRAALVPVRRLTSAAERVARTQDLTHRIQAGEQDELGRLAGTFNAMLAALERSRLAQRRLVSDASHELRTPLTSVQANLDALAMGERLPASERARVITAARAQLQELTVLVGDLVDLSKTEVEELEVEDVRLDLAAAGALERARLHAPACLFALDSEPCLVRAAPARLDRAISNLLDNACKWNPPSPPAGPIEVRVRAGRLEVRDHGPGIAAEDLPRVFDRFYRAPEARGRPGSGLGLAIVRQTAEAHGGSVHAANQPDGGTRLTLELPPLQMSDDELLAAKRERPRGSGPVHEAPRSL
jgi:two-component system sensor histidine kinase MprB